MPVTAAPESSTLNPGVTRPGAGLGDESDSRDSARGIGEAARSHSDDVVLAMVSAMRLLLAVAGLLTMFIDQFGVHGAQRLPWAVFAAYSVYSLAIFSLARSGRPFVQRKLVYWIDAVWITVIVYCTGGGQSYFATLFIFVILTASFHWGFDEGAHITLASAALLTLAAVMADPRLDLPLLLLRTTFLLALGYMLSYWGGSSLAQKRRLALLRSVSLLSNPRFGVDHTLASMLEKIRVFYGGGSCVLIMRDSVSDGWLLRTAMADDSNRPLKPSRISGAAAGPLLAFDHKLVLFSQPLWNRLPWSGDARMLEPGQTEWTPAPVAACALLAELLEAHSFISTPLPLRRGEGRIYVMSPTHRYGKSDALFLNHIGAQAFPVIEHIELLDTLVSEAAFRERQKIARDLHDTAIQPYIGLRHGLHALRGAAAADNPLGPELDRLIDMTEQVVGEMRNFTQSMKNQAVSREAELLIALQRQMTQILTFYGIAIVLKAEGELRISDRMAAEVFQIVNEGMSNMRKHTNARSGSVSLRTCPQSLHIEIDNAAHGKPAGDFLPLSIAERSAALGGSVQVQQRPDGSATVRITIPL